MSLINCVKNDLDLWLKENDDSNVIYYTNSIIIERINNGNCEKFENIKKSFSDIQSIRYNKRQVHEFTMSKNVNGNITGICFVQLNRFLPGLFYPWIEIDKDSITFNYIDYHNYSKSKSEVMDIKQIKSIRGFYEIAKSITLSYAQEIYKKDIETYYDSLPLFESLAYTLEEICDFPQGDIIIEI